jgi:chromosome segregation ATPase
MEWLYIISAIASSLAAVLAWAAKLWWGREFASAKDEIIKAKEVQIELLKDEINSLKELTPMKVREYFLSVREQMEEYNDLLKNQLDEAQKELNKKQEEIENLKQEGDKTAGEIEKLEAERQSIADAAKTLEDQLSTLRKKYESQDAIIFRIPKIDTDIYKNINTSYEKLVDAMAKEYSKDVSELSKTFIKLEPDLLKEIFKNQYILPIDKGQREKQKTEDEDENSIDSGEKKCD